MGVGLKYQNKTLKQMYMKTKIYIVNITISSSSRNIFETIFRNIFYITDIKRTTLLIFLSSFSVYLYYVGENEVTLLVWELYQWGYSGCHRVGVGAIGWEKV